VYKRQTGEEFDIFPEDDNVVYVWRPYGVSTYWTPYTNGNWMFSNSGWVWTSYYNWGWAPYNYGRWYYSNFYGWIWFPGSLWAPNWVTWRYSGNYVGWYPSCPRVYWRGLHKNIYTNHQFAYIPRNWVFVDKKDFKKKIDNTNIASGEHNVKLLRESKKVTTAIFTDPTMPKFKYTGPDADLIAKETGTDIKPVQISVKQSGGKYVAEYVDTKEPVKSGANTGIRNPKLNNSKEETEIKNQKEEVKKSNTREPKVINPPVEKNTKKHKEKVNTTKPVPKEKTVKTNQPKEKNNPVGTSDQNKSNSNETKKSIERIPVKK
jgi:hypothetical protein